MNIKTMILFGKNITLYCAVKCMNSSALSYSQILLNDDCELPAWYPWDGRSLEREELRHRPRERRGLMFFAREWCQLILSRPPSADVHSERLSVQTLNIKRLLASPRPSHMDQEFQYFPNMWHTAITNISVGAENGWVIAMTSQSDGAGRFVRLWWRG